MMRNRYKLISLVFLLIVIIFVGCNLNLGRSKEADVKISYVTDGRVLPSENEQNLKELFSPVIEDVNGDSEKEITFSPIHGLGVNFEFFDKGSQIVLMNYETFKTYVGFGVFDPLDDYILKNNIDLSVYPELKVKTEDSIEAHVYAIPVNNTHFLCENGFPANDYYISIRKAINNEKEAVNRNFNAHQILKKLLANL